MVGMDWTVRGSAAPGDAAVKAAVLGRFEVHVGDRLLARADWQRVSAERLVKLLLVTRGHVLTRAVATELLWPEMEPATGSATFRKALHYAHRALEEAVVLKSDGPTVSLVASRLDLDLDRLLDAFTTVETTHDDQLAADAVETILELGSEDLLPDDLYEEWLAGPRERLRSRWQAVALVAARRAGDRGDAPRAIAILGQILERDDTDEAAHRMAIDLYARDGRHHAARRQFELCREALRRELEIEPSAETIAAFEAAEHLACAPAGLTRPPRFVARRAEIERIEPVLDRVAAERSAGLVLRGPIGIGKTRLLREVAGYAGAAGWRVAWWQATDATRVLPYSQTAAALAELAPSAVAASWAEPGRSAAATLRSAGDPGVLLPFTTPEALLAGLVSAFDSATRPGPVMIAVDDLPLLDDGSLDVLRAILGALSQRPLLVAATCRDDEPWPVGTTAFVDEVRRAGGVELAVGPLGPKDVEPLIVTNLGGHSVQGDVVRSAYNDSAGNPLFCLEIVQASRDRGALRLESGRWTVVAGAPDAEVPPTVQRLVANRSGMLSPQTVDLLATAAELGTACTYATLAAVHGADGQLMRMLDEALGSGLLVEQGRGYGFAHPLYRRAVTERTTAGRRAAVRLAIARALAGPGADVADPTELAVLAGRHSDPAPVADHALVAASAGQAAAAPLGVAFGFAAGERLWRLFDREAAFAVLDRSLRAWQRLDPVAAAAFDAVRAWRTMADLHRAAGDEKARVDASREAARVARNPEGLADAYVGLAHIPYAHGDFAAAIAILEEGAARLPADARVARARIGSQIAWSLARLRRLDEALPEAERAADVLLQHGDRPGSMRALDILGMVLMYVGQREEAIRRLEGSLALALELPDPEWEMRVRHHVGTAHVRGGEAARGRPHLERGVELAILIGDRYGEAVGHWAIAEMEHRLGDYAGAAVHRRRELELLEELGGNPHNEAMAHAHLAHLARIAGDRDTSRDETEAARRLARRSPDPGYSERLEANLAVDDWSQADT